MVTLMLSEESANLVGKINQNAIALLQYAGFSCVKNEAYWGYLKDSLYIPLKSLDDKFGILNCLIAAGYKVEVRCQ